MAKLRNFEIKFTASVSQDVVTNKLYVDNPGELSYDSPNWDVGNDINTYDDKVHVNLGSFLDGYDGSFDIGIAAIDDGGNEADMQTMSAVPLDFVAPDAVTGLELV